MQNVQFEELEERVSTISEERAMYSEGEEVELES
jgi:pantocin A family RiPP